MLVVFLVIIVEFLLVVIKHSVILFLNLFQLSLHKLFSQFLNLDIFFLLLNFVLGSFPKIETSKILLNGHLESKCWEHEIGYIETCLSKFLDINFVTSFKPELLERTLNTRRIKLNLLLFVLLSTSDLL